MFAGYSPKPPGTPSPLLTEIPRLTTTVFVASFLGFISKRFRLNPIRLLWLAYWGALLAQYSLSILYTLLDSRDTYLAYASILCCDEMQSISLLLIAESLVAPAVADSGLYSSLRGTFFIVMPLGLSMIILSLIAPFSDVTNNAEIFLGFFAVSWFAIRWASTVSTSRRTFIALPILAYGASYISPLLQPQEGTLGRAIISGVLLLLYISLGYACYDSLRRYEIEALAMESREEDELLQGAGH